MNSKISNKSEKTWTILHTNLRGFSSKEISLKSIINQMKPNIVTMNEVDFRKDKKVSISGYSSYTRNRKNNENMGGVATAIVNEENQQH